MAVAALSTIMDLFAEGGPASAEAPNGQTITVWVNKLSPFEKEDCDRAGRAGRAKRVLAWDKSEDEQAIYEMETAGYGVEELVEALAGLKDNTHYFEAVADLRADEEWAERLEYLAQVDLLQVGGEDASDEDKALLQKVTAEYMEAVEKIQKRLGKEYADDLREKGEEVLRAEYRTAWRDMEGMRAFYEERRFAEIYFATRECKGKVEGGKMVHTKCNHQVRLLGNRKEVRDLPEPVLAAITATLQAIDISPDAAGNSDAPKASSEPSEPQSTEEESTPSIPTETSAVPVGT